MLATHLGFYNTASTRTHVRFQFSTHAAAGGNVAPNSAFEAADLRIYKAADGAAFSATQRSSANGITMTSPFDSLTGFHDVDIDLADNTDAGFYAAGGLYSVVLAPDETVDGQTLTGVVLAYFEIGRQQADVREIGGDAQSATDLKDFADAGYDPATNKVEGVKLADTLTTYTGNTPQTGDSFARIGANGASLTALGTAAELAKVPKSDSNVTWNATAAAQLQSEANDALVAYDPPTRAEATADKDEILTTADAIETDTQDLQNRVPAALDSGRIVAKAEVVSDKTGYGLSAGSIQAIWDALTAALTTVGSIGKKLADWVIGTTQTGDSFARLGAPAGASHAADIAALKTVADAVNAKTANLPASPAAVGSAMTLEAGERDAIAAALLDLADGVETDVTVRQSLRAMAATLAGDQSGGPGSPVYKSIGGSTDRVTSTADADGNRTVVVDL